MTVSALSEEFLIPLLQKFVRYPSEQTDLQEDDPKVQSFVKECVASELRKLDIPEPSFDEKGNLFVEVGNVNSDETLMFVTYAMTHPAASMTNPFAGEIVETPKGPAIRGRGVAEQKTSLVAALAALREAAKYDLDGRLIFATVCAGETGRHDAVESVLKQVSPQPDKAIICIGTDGKVAFRNKGRIDINVLVEGKSTHSSMPWNGIDAIDGARECLNALSEIKLSTPAHEYLGPPTLTATGIRSGPDATHTLQSEVAITFDRRLLPGENVDAAFSHICENIPAAGPWSVKCERGPIMYPNEIKIDGPLMGGLNAAFRRAGYEKANCVDCDFALDAGYFGHLGSEAVMLGAGEINQFHSDNECVLTEDLVSMSKIYFYLIQEILNSEKAT